ncbi:hypothetical protein PINS_up009236 [Pythium insidiosum]|nr:hypothetical protein PINS_up009236 [Pythium insidiosum]
MDAAEDTVARTESPPGSAGSVGSASRAGVPKKTLALWKKQLKNLKLKDTGKKLEGIRFCVQDERFLREPDVLAQLMGMLSRVKVHGLYLELAMVLSNVGSVVDARADLRDVADLADACDTATTRSNCCRWRCH